MALILQLETSTISCSVALSLDGNTIAVKELAERNIHAGYLTLFIEDVVAQCGKSLRDIDSVAVSMGPGSYTGLRIGVSTAKGLCYALDIPLIAINTLQAMTVGFMSLYNDQSVLFCPMIDARRMEVYAAVYNSQLDELLPVEARIIDENSFSDLLQNQNIVFFGDGAMKCQEVLAGNPTAIFVPEFLNSAKDLSSLAALKYDRKEFEDVAYFEPFYLKDFLITQSKKS